MKVRPNKLTYSSLGTYGPPVHGPRAEGAGTFLQSVGPYGQIGLIGWPNLNRWIFHEHPYFKTLSFCNMFFLT